MFKIILSKVHTIFVKKSCFDLPKNGKKGQKLVLTMRLKKQKVSQNLLNMYKENQNVTEMG